MPGAAAGHVRQPPPRPPSVLSGHLSPILYSGDCIGPELFPFRIHVRFLVGIIIYQVPHMLSLFSDAYVLH